MILTALTVLTQLSTPTCLDVKNSFLQQECCPDLSKIFDTSGVCPLGLVHAATNADFALDLHPAIEDHLTQSFSAMIPAVFDLTAVDASVRQQLFPDDAIIGIVPIVIPDIRAPSGALLRGIVWMGFNTKIMMQMGQSAVLDNELVCLVLYLDPDTGKVITSSDGHSLPPQAFIAGGNHLQVQRSSAQEVTYTFSPLTNVTYSGSAVCDETTCVTSFHIGAESARASLLNDVDQMTFDDNPFTNERWYWKNTWNAISFGTANARGITIPEYLFEFESTLSMMQQNSRYFRDIIVWDEHHSGALKEVEMGDTAWYIQNNVATEDLEEYLKAHVFDADALASPEFDYSVFNLRFPALLQPALFLPGEHQLTFSLTPRDSSTTPDDYIIWYTRRMNGKTGEIFGDRAVLIGGQMTSAYTVNDPSKLSPTQKSMYKAQIGIDLDEELGNDIIFLSMSGVGEYFTISDFGTLSNPFTSIAYYPDGLNTTTGEPIGLPSYAFMRGYTNRELRRPLTETEAQRFFANNVIIYNPEYVWKPDWEATFCMDYTVVPPVPQACTPYPTNIYPPAMFASFDDAVAAIQNATEEQRVDIVSLLP